MLIEILDILATLSYRKEVTDNLRKLNAALQPEPEEPKTDNKPSPKSKDYITPIGDYYDKR